jgi:hypothetical protein
MVVMLPPPQEERKKDERTMMTINFILHYLLIRDTPWGRNADNRSMGEIQNLDPNYDVGCAESQPDFL